MIATRFRDISLNPKERTCWPKYSPQYRRPYYSRSARWPAHAQDANALLDLLVKKKILTEKEAQSVRADLSKGSPPVTASVNSGDKWKLSTPITEIELYGDARVRYEYRGGQITDNASGHDDWQERERERYRLRLGLHIVLVDDWFAGIRLETSQNPRSTNVTFGDDTAGERAGRWGALTTKGSDGINVGQAYLGYKGFKDVTLDGGQDAESARHHADDVGCGHQSGRGSRAVETHFYLRSRRRTGHGLLRFKMGRALPEAHSEPAKLKLDLFANFAQFVYDDVDPEDPLGPRGTIHQPNQRGSRAGFRNTDAWLLAWQVGAKLTFPQGVYLADCADALQLHRATATRLTPISRGAIRA